MQPILKDIFFNIYVKTTHVTHNKKSRRNKNNIPPREYLWTLSKGHIRELTAEEIKDREPEFGPGPQEIFSYQDIGDGVTVDFVSNLLKQKNCFYFDYVPNEGDCLAIQVKNSRLNLFLGYVNNEWVTVSFQDFYFSDRQLIDRGIVDLLYI
jgi:hypothetical protein